MAAHYATKGFVFKREDRSEADRVFSVFTRDFGRVEIFAKAIRKITSKLKGGIEIFALSDIEFIQGKNRKTLIEAALAKKFTDISKVPEKIIMAGRVSLLLDNFIKGQEADERIWNLIVDFFEKLSNEKLIFPGQRLYYYFFWNFISALGYKPELSTCAACNQALYPATLYFSSNDGGILCQDCFAVRKTGEKIHPDVVKVLRVMLKNDWDTLLKLKIQKSSQKELEQISENYYRYLLPGHFS